MKKVIDIATRSVRFTFDGDLEPVVMHAEQMSAANYDYACLHGLAARIGDNAAIQKSAENGYVVTDAMRREAVLELVTFYEDAENKEWNVKRASGPRAPAKNPLWQKLADARGVDYDVVAAEKAAADLAELMAMTTMQPPRGE